MLDEGKRVKYEVSRDSDRRPVASRNGSPNQYIEIRPKQTIEVWLRHHQIAYVAPPPLPSEHYADASHPLSVGYAELARELWRHEFFGLTGR